MNVSIFSQMAYENKSSNWTLGENKPNSNPIKACPERSRMGQSPKGQNELKIACQKIRPHPREFGRKVYCGIHTGKDGTIRIALQVYISHTITNRTEFFTRKGQLL